MHNDAFSQEFIRSHIEQKYTLYLFIKIKTNSIK